MNEMQGRPRTAHVVERWRLQARLSKQRLADLADVSATYVRTIEAGADDEGRIVVPSAGIIRKLARGLALAERDETLRADIEQRAYAELMDAAGYLDHAKADEPAGEGGLPALREAAPPLAYAAPAAATGPAVLLRDPRLWGHARELLENWEWLDADDQALLLGIIEFVHGRHGRSPNKHTGGS